MQKQFFKDFRIGLKGLRTFFLLKNTEFTGQYPLDILIRKISQGPIGLHGQGANANYIPKFQVSTMSLEVA